VRKGRERGRDQLRLARSSAGSGTIVVCPEVLSTRGVGESWANKSYRNKQRGSTVTLGEAEAGGREGLSIRFREGVEVGGPWKLKVFVNRRLVWQEASYPESEGSSEATIGSRNVFCVTVRGERSSRRENGTECQGSLR